MADLPSITGNDIPQCGPDGFLTIVSRSVTQKDVKNAFDAGAAEKFVTENIAEPTKDQEEFERRGFNNVTATVVQTWRNAARGDKADRNYALDRTIGPVEQRSVNINANVSLDSYLENLDVSDVTDLELEEAGIVIDVEEVIDDEENYVADM